MVLFKITGEITTDTREITKGVKENIIKMKREPTVWENIFTSDTLDKGLISPIYKELT